MAATSDKKVNVVLTVNAVNFSSGINQIKGKLNELGGASKATSHAMVSDVQATSGALRLMEGGMTGNIRAAERFLASIKGVGTALQFIYPAVGLIAVGAVIAKGVTELTNFIKKTKEAGAEFRASFQEMENSARLSNDELAKTNINLENTIAKLTGKHENVVAAELAEAKVQADNLAISAARAAKEIKDLLEKGEGTFLQKIFQSGNLDSELEGNINNFEALKAQAYQDKSDAQHRGDKAGADAAQKRYEQQLKNERAYLLQQRDFRSGTGDRDAAFDGDQTRNLDAINATLNLNYSQSDRIDLDAQNIKDSKGVKTVEDAKSFAEKAQAAQRKADEDHLRALQEAFELQKAAATMQPWETKTNFEQRQRLAQSNYYLGHLKDFKTDATRKEVFDLGQKPLDEYNTTDTEGRAALQKMLAGQGSAEGIFAGLGDEKDTQARLKAQQEAVSAQSELANKLRETAVSQDLQSGAISKYDAAVQMAALHTEAYQLQLEKLQAEARQIANDPTLNEEQRRTKLIGIGSQIDQLGQSHDAQRVSDQQDINEQTGLGGWKQSLDQFVQQSRDTAAQVRDIWTNALTSVNDEIVKVISTRHNYNTRVEFGNIGAGIFRNVAGAALNKGEGALMGALGFGGKPDGSSSKPFHVIMAGVGGAASGAANALGSAANGATSGIGKFLGKIGGFFSGLGFAGGGQPPVGMASLVGENGPELFVPHTVGTVIPAGSFGGVTHNWNVDARGATDPAMVNAAVQRGIQKAMPTINALTAHSQADHKARRPSGAR